MPVEFNLTINLDIFDFSKLTRAQTAAFFQGIAEILAAKESIEVEAKKGKCDESE